MRHPIQGLLLLMVAMGAANCRSRAQEAPTVSAAKPQTESQLPGPPGNFRRVFAEVANKTIPSVVSIVSQRSVAAPQSPFDFFGGVDPFKFFFDRPGERVPMYRSSGSESPNYPPRCASATASMPR